MPRPSDGALTSPEFKIRLRVADEYAWANDLDQWAVRVFWVALTCSPLAARRYAQRRSNHQESRAWACYTRLIERGILCEDPEGVFYWETKEFPEEAEKTLKWFDAIVKVAAGGKVPKGLPLCLLEEAPHLRLVANQ